MPGSQLRVEAQRTLAFGSIGATYTAIGTPITNQAQILTIQNLTDAALQFSFDGVVDHLPLAAGTSIVLDATSDKTENAEGLYISGRTQFYVKEIDTPTTGAVYVTPIYSR